MLQRVGIAQALINEPDLVILDEPMSGLDPLGRRDVRALILRLRDRGCTVFFSSHVLSDAEALCSRVAILAKGRLVASGLLKEMLAFNVRGWELVVADMGDEAMAKLGPRVKSAVAIGGGRFQLELPLETHPEQLLVDVVAAGGASGVAQPHPRNARGPVRGESRGPRVRTLGWIAMNGFRESVRDKVLYNLVAFAILLMGTSYLLGQLTAGQDLKIMKDLGLSAMAVFGLFMAVFIGIGLVSKEVERRSIYSLMAKPIRRYQIVVGKYAGLVLTLTVNVAIMTIALYAVLAYVGWGENEFAKAAREAPDLDPALLKAIVLILVQLMIVTAIATFFSTFSTPILSAALTFGFYVAGYFSADLRNFDQVVDSKAVQWLARGLYYVLPNLAPFDVRGPGRPWLAGHRRLHGGDDRVRACLHRDAADSAAR